jgi:hypothetical protein
LLVNQARLESRFSQNSTAKFRSFHGHVKCSAGIFGDAKDSTSKIGFYFNGVVEIAAIEQLFDQLSLG